MFEQKKPIMLEAKTFSQVFFTIVDVPRYDRNNISHI